jgi:Regulator of chromosome condensation (RCC1) repeat
LLVIFASGCGREGAHAKDASGDATGASNDAAAGDSASDAATSDVASMDAVIEAAPEVAADAGTDLADGAAPADVAVDIAADVKADASASADASDGPKRVPYLATAVSVGRYDACVILDDGKMKCWGNNSYGELGLGDGRGRGASPSEMGDALPTVDLGTGRTALQISVGRYTTCALLDNHSVKCWGLGLNMVADAPKNFIGNEPGEMGDALPVMDLGPGRTAKRVAAGNFFACVERDDASLRCWATSLVGAFDVALPTGRKVSAMTGAGTIGLLLDDGSVWKAFLTVDSVARLAAVDLGAGRRGRAIGSSISRFGVALDGGGVVGDDTAMSSFAKADLFAVAYNEYEQPCGLRADGGVTCWGYRGNPVWGEGFAKANPDDLTGTVNVKLGGEAIDLQGGGWSHACALLADHSVRCWGNQGSNGLPELGASFVADGADAGASPRWSSVDLGTHPAR